VNHWRCFRNFSGGQAAELTVQYAVPGGAVGDFDFDNDLDAADLAAFVAVLLGSNGDCIARAIADLSGDGRTDGQDIGPFVTALLSDP
jgi:hypothetical protein